MGKKTLVAMVVIALVFSFFPALSGGADKCGWLCYGGGETGINVAPESCGPIGGTLMNNWSTMLPSPVLSQPAVDGKNMYFGTFKNVFYCIDTSNGSIKWEQTIGGSVYSTPCIDESNVYICSWDRKAYCFDKNTGKRKWAFGTELYIFNSPMVKGDWLFIGSRDEKLYCLNPQTGGRIWEMKVGPVTSTPIIADYRIFIAEHEGTVYCVDPIKRESIWEVKLGGIIESCLAYSNGKVFVGCTMSGESVFYCLDAKDGKEVWKYKADTGIWSDPCVGGGMVFASVEDHLYAISEKTGKEVWKDILEKGSYSQVAYCANNIYYGTTKNGFFMKKADTGETVFNQPERSSVKAPSISQNMIFYGCEDGTIRCLKGEDERVASITIAPQDAVVCVNATEDFTASGKLNTGEAVPSIKPVWSVADPTIGTIDQNGVFTGLKTGITKIVANYQNVKAEATITVREFIRVTPNPVVFNNVPPGTIAKVDVNMENLIGRNLDYKVSFDCPKLSADPATGTIWIDSARFAVNADTNNMKPGDSLKCTMKIEFEKAWVTIPVTVIISKDAVQCLKIEPYMLDFGYVPRGSTKTLEFKIHYQGIPTKGTIRPLQAWIEVEPNEFDSTKPEQVFKVTISSSALPTGDSFGGSMRFEMDESMCQQASLNVVIKTDNGIVLKLVIDNTTATINGSPVKLDVPAKLISGRTMVPIRFISESFGCKVNWDKVSKEITIYRHQMKFQLWLGKNYAMVNGNKQPLDSPPVIVDGRTLVPLRFISEPFGAKVEWNQKSREIKVVWDPN